MTLPPVIRIFFAVDLPLATKEQIGSFIGSLKKASKSHAVRWTKPENLHITLQFLAEVQSEHLPALMKNVRTEIAGVINHTRFTFSNLHLFPNPYMPRVIVLGVQDQTDLSKMAELIGNGIKATAYKTEERPFRGHLTLGRIKHAQGVNLNFLSEVIKPEVEAVDVNEIVLFRSESQPEGSKYSVLERIVL